MAFGTVAQLADPRSPRLNWERAITVPFPPEASASGIGEEPPEGVTWYRRGIGEAALIAAGWEAGRRVLVHFGAVDYQSDVWIDGHYLGHHQGGQTPFAFDITFAITDGSADHELIVRAHDDRTDVRQPRGKQDWQVDAHDIWYHRTSGIWQPVWLESVPNTYLADIHSTPHVETGVVEVEATLGGDLTGSPIVSVELFDGDDLISTGSVLASTSNVKLLLELPSLRNGQDLGRWLWTPEAPHLLGARVIVGTDSARDEVGTYLGLRSVRVDGRDFLLNERPYRLRAVLTQGYWPESHLAAPSPSHLRAEVDLIKSLGFNAARVHQKAEDPRFLYWADRLGLLVWGETAAAFEFSADAVRRMAAEWMEVVERDRSHPCIVTWVPINESWGVQHIGTQFAQQHFALALGSLTRALDPNRPALTNDGWEHLASDLVTIHDYEPDPATIAERYGDVRTPHDDRACGRRVLLAPHGEKPVILSEFGGISLASETDADGWGYSTARDVDDFATRLRALFAAARTARGLAGFCYTQLCDTAQEMNGLATAQRVPKLAPEIIRGFVTGKETAERG